MTMGPMTHSFIGMADQIMVGDTIYEVSALITAYEKQKREQMVAHVPTTHLVHYTDTLMDSAGSEYQVGEVLNAWHDIRSRRYVPADPERASHTLVEGDEVRVGEVVYRVLWSPAGTGGYSIVDSDTEPRYRVLLPHTFIGLKRGQDLQADERERLASSHLADLTRQIADSTGVPSEALTRMLMEARKRMQVDKEPVGWEEGAEFHRRVMDGVEEEIVDDEAPEPEGDGLTFLRLLSRLEIVINGQQHTLCEAQVSDGRFLLTTDHEDLWPPERILINGHQHEVVQVEVVDVDGERGTSWSTSLTTEPDLSSYEIAASVWHPIRTGMQIWLNGTRFTVQGYGRKHGHLSLAVQEWQDLEPAEPAACGSCSHAAHQPGRCSWRFSVSGLLWGRCSCGDPETKVDEERAPQEPQETLDDVWGRIYADLFDGVATALLGAARTVLRETTRPRR